MPIRRHIYAVFIWPVCGLRLPPCKIYMDRPVQTQLRRHAKIHNFYRSATGHYVDEDTNTLCCTFALFISDESPAAAAGMQTERSVVGLCP